MVVDLKSGNTHFGRDDGMDAGSYNGAQEAGQKYGALTGT